MLRMGKLTDYATVVLASLAQDPTRHRAAAELAERTRLSRPTVSKVLKGLQRSGLVISSRGALGGYRLARGPEQITAAQILYVGLREGFALAVATARVGHQDIIALRGKNA